MVLLEECPIKKFIEIDNKVIQYDNLIPLNIHFFDGEEKTEKATGKKRTDTRKEGQVAKSPEVTTAIMLIIGFASLGMFSGYMMKKLTEIFMYNNAMQREYLEIFEPVFLADYVSYIFGQVFMIVLPIFAVAMIVGFVTNIVQVGWLVTTKPLMPKFSKLNPISGFKRMFSLKAVVELFKSVLKFGLILYIVYSVIKDYIDYLPIVFQFSVAQIMQFGGSIIVKLGVTVGAVYLFIAGLDYAYTKYKHEKDIRMSKQEIKEEYKNIEGNPLIKGQIRQKMREASMRRMMQDLPQADVIITNPTHYAVAIKYEKDSGKAPIVVAKGVDFLAKKIREVATENEIEIVEDKPLARTLYANVDIGKEIPPELYKAVAEILAYVYKIKDKLV